MGGLIMSAVENGKAIEVTDGAVVAQQVVATSARGVVEGEIVEGIDASPRAGGVQNSEVILNSDVCISREIVATTVQNLPVILNSSVEMSVAPVVPQRAQSPAEFLALPPPTLPGKRGPKRLITPAVAEQLCMLLSIGLSRRNAALYLNISPGTITNAVARDPALGEDLKQAEEMALIHPELTIIAEARRNWKAAIWYLEYKGKNPRPMSEEEKEEKHQAALADARRSNELTDVFLRSEKPVRPTESSPKPGRSKGRK